jgi:hypothetical protein
MVYDSGKRPDGFHNNDNLWKPQHIPEPDPFGERSGQNANDPNYWPPLKRKPKAEVAQAIPIKGPIPIGFPLPEVPWMTQQDLLKIYNFISNGLNPFTGRVIETQEEKKALKNLTGAQIKGLSKTKYADEIDFAQKSFRSRL